MHCPPDNSMLDAMEIAPGYSVADWKSLDLGGNNAKDWSRAVQIFEIRIRRRFIEPADVLIAHEIGSARGAFGFAILAIDCLLIETMQGFREGIVDHTGQSGRLVRTFLSQCLSVFFDDGAKMASKAGAFYERCRCGLHHSGQTDGDFRVRRSGPLIEFKQNDAIVVNRTAFHEALKREFDAYCAELMDSSKMELRANFRIKLNAICGIDDPASKGSTK